MVSQFNQVIQIFNLAYFSKIDQTDQYEQEVYILQPSIVGTAFIHPPFFGSLLFEHFSPSKQQKSRDRSCLRRPNRPAAFALTQLGVEA
jgi:hypothetical protein